MSITPDSPGPAQQPVTSPPGGPVRPPEVLIAGWSWSLSAVPGAVAAYLGATADGLTLDDSIIGPALVVTGVLLWGVRIVLAVLMVRSAPRRGAVIRILLVVFGLIASAANDPSAWIRSGGDPTVVTLVVLDVMLVVAGTVLLFRPPVVAYFRVAVVAPPVPQDPRVAVAPPAGWSPPTNTMAVLALIFAFVFSPLGAVFGFVARRQIRRTGESGSGLALAGIIVGITYTVLTVGLFTVALVGSQVGS